MEKLFIFLSLFSCLEYSMMKVAHRGASAHYPENTLTAFVKALELGADMIELDIHKSKDGHLVVFHDDQLDRMTDGSGNIADKTIKELKALKVLGQEKIPTLSEALDLIDAKCKLDLELKGKNIAKRVADFLKEYVKKSKWKYEDLIITSFDHVQILQLHQLLPHVQVGFIYDHHKLPTNLAVVKRQGISWLVVWFKDITSEFVQRAHSLDLKILVYTVNDDSDINFIRSLDVDACAMDY